MLAAVIAVVLASPAVAAPSQVLVVSVDDTPPSTGFLDALRIQLAGSAGVEVGGRLDGATTAARIEAASRLAVGPVALVAWVERAGADQVLYAVGGHSERALVDAFRQPATGGPDADRALALKVREVLDQVMMAPPAASAEPVAPPPAPDTGVAAPAVIAPPVDPTRLAAAMELVARGALSSPGGQLGGGLTLAGGVRRGRSAADVYALGYVATAVSSATTDAEVEARELGAGGGARAVVGVGPVALGAGAELSGRRVHASATTTAGEHASRTLWLAVLTPLAEARYPIADGIDLRIAAGVDIALTRQRFSVNESTVLDLGRTRARLDLSLMLRLR